MKAMILAAGLGTRLHPLTHNKPKALIEIHGKTLLEIVLQNLIDAGVGEVIINLHHFPEQIKSFLRANSFFGIHIEFSYEKKLLNTGGGLKNAAHFFKGDEPFYLHNVDIVSDIDLKKMYDQHCHSTALATLAVQKRKTSRYLIFDEQDNLCGWKSLAEQRTILPRKPAGSTVDLGFCGIHVISPEIFALCKETGTFSIIQTYLRLISEGTEIRAFHADGYRWLDLGKTDQLKRIQDEKIN